MTDTMARWAAVYSITGKLKLGWAMEQWLQPTMDIFMLPIGVFDLPTDFFTFAQIGYLILACSIWITMTSSQRPFWIPLTLLLPLVFVYTSFVIPDVWTFAALLVIVGSVFSLEQGTRWTPVILFFISCIILFGFRQNALTLVPMVFIMVVRSKTISLKLKGLLLVLMVLSLGFIFEIPARLGFVAKTSSAAAPAWELLGMLRLAKELQITVDANLTLDEFADTNRAIEQHSFTTIDTILWGREASLSGNIIMAHPDEIKTKWLRMIMDHPSLYFLMKMKTYKCMLGLCDEYLQTQIHPYEPWPTLNGLVSTYNQPKGIAGIAFELGNWAGLAWKALIIPIFWLPVTIFVFLFSWRTYGHQDRWLIAMTGVYMASFLILTQAASFRYMFPVYVVFTAYQIRFIGWLMILCYERISRRLTSFEQVKA
jgi:hypothetical protein